MQQTTRVTHWAVLGVIISVLAAGMIPVRALAQDDPDAALARIRDAYQAYESWDTFRVEVDDSVRYALVVEGKGAQLLQQQEYDMALAGWYDFSGPDGARALLDFSGSLSGQQSDAAGRTPLSWTSEGQLGLVENSPFWRGSFDSQQDGVFALPEEWQDITSRTLEDSPLAAADLDRYLQPDRISLTGDWAAWLDAVESVTGPQPFDLDKQTSGDLYILDVNLSKLPAELVDFFPALTSGSQAVVQPEALLGSLQKDSTLTWGVVLEPDSGRLLAQLVDLDLSAKMGAGGGLASPYSSLSLAFTQQHHLLFRDVNVPVEALDASALPE